MIDDGMVPSDLLLVNSSPRDLADAGMMQLASAMGPDIEETETDGVTNSSSSPKKAAILAEAQQLSGGRDNHSELPTESNDTDMSVHVELGLDHSDGGAASPRSENRMKTNTNTNALGVAFKARQYSSSSSENTGIYSRQTPFASTAVVESPNGYGGLFGSQSISMSMDLGDISSSRLAFGSVDWHDMMSSNLAGMCMVIYIANSSISLISNLGYILYCSWQHRPTTGPPPAAPRRAHEAVSVS